MVEMLGVVIRRVLLFAVQFELWEETGWLDY